MRISNIFLVICLIFITILFFVSPYLLKSPDLEDRGVFIGKVIKEPDKRSSNTKLTIKTDQERILVTVASYPEYNYGDILEIKGELQEPMVFDDFNYKNYLAKDGIHFVMYYPQVKVLENKKSLYGLIFKIKNKVRERIERIMPFPEVSILEAITLGYKQGLSDDLKEKLNVVGVRHIVAISGMHIPVPLLQDYSMLR